MRAPVKRFLTLALIALPAVVLAGCGSGKRATTTLYEGKVIPAQVSGSITVTGNTTVADVKTGTLVRCKGGQSAKVPRRGAGVSESTGGDVAPTATTAPSYAEISLTHLPNGSVTVTCKKSH
jgi:hypothetical protein